MIKWWPEAEEAELRQADWPLLGADRKASHTKKPRYCEAFCIWCPEAESNHRHEDFQSSALPTELSGHIFSCLAEGLRLRLRPQQGAY